MAERDQDGITITDDHGDLHGARELVRQFLDALEGLTVFAQRVDTAEIVRDREKRDGLAKLLTQLKAAVPRLIDAVEPLLDELESVIFHYEYGVREREPELGYFGGWTEGSGWTRAMHSWLLAAEQEGDFARPTDEIVLGDAQFKTFLQHRWENVRGGFSDWHPSLHETRRKIEAEFDAAMRRRADVVNQLLAGVSRFRATEPPPPLAPPPLTETERRVLDVIKAQPDGSGISGREIIRELNRQNFPIEQSTLTRHIIPRLRNFHGVRNRKSVGYYHVKPGSP